MVFTAKDRPRIGWIGCGRMGFQLASRLLDAGHDVAVYNRTRAKAEPLAERGATIVDRLFVTIALLIGLAVLGGLVFSLWPFGLQPIALNRSSPAPPRARTLENKGLFR